MTDFDWMFGDASDEDELETARMPDARILKRESKAKAIAALKKEKAKDILTALPAEGESWHIISNGSFDYFNFCPIIIDYLHGYTEQFFGSTWTMSRGNVLELLELIDSGKIGRISMMTGIYFKRRESAVYATLLEGLQERHQRFLCFENHAKIMLFNHKNTYIVMEGSANFTANPRLEQNVITQSKALWEFHWQWINEMFNAPSKENK